MIRLYLAETEMIDKDGFGHSLWPIYQASDDLDAIHAAVRFLKARAKNLLWRPGALLVSVYSVSHIDMRGDVVAPHSAPFFTWKADFSFTVDQAVGYFEKEIERKNGSL